MVVINIFGENEKKILPQTCFFERKNVYT